MIAAGAFGFARSVKLIFLVVLLGLSAAPAFAVNPDEVLADPVLEERARNLSMQLRCLVCQNQSIDDSNAELAKDLRLLVRERLVKGDSDQDVIGYIVSRYGEFVLLKPPLALKTYLLWGAPLVLFLIGAIAMFTYGRNRVGTAPEKLTAEEEQRLKTLLAENGTDQS